MTDSYWRAKRAQYLGVSIEILNIFVVRQFLNAHAQKYYCQGD